MTLNGQRVLLVAPRFFGYDQDIRQELLRRGAKVDLLPDRPFDTPFMTALTKVNPALILPAADRLYGTMLEEFGAGHYDLVLVINGQTLSQRTLRSLRSRFSTARFVLYMWDSMENRQGVVRNLPLFDATFSFDPASAQEYGMTLRPLFFAPGFERPASDDRDIDVSFIGTAHTDRYAVVDKLRRGLPAHVNAYWYLYLQAPWVYHFYRLTKPAMRGADRNDFQFSALPKTQLQAVFARSKAVLDIEHPLQRGLTMRTFETMGSNKKLITTNARVADYDFFDAGNIAIVDRKNPRLPAGFLDMPYRPVPPAIYRRYSIGGWMDELIAGMRGLNTGAA